MDLRVVYCAIGESCKRVKIPLNNGESDATNVMKCVRELSVSDNVIRKIIGGKEFVLQVHNKILNRLCDLEVDDVLLENDVITVTILTNPTNLSSAPTSSTDSPIPPQPPSTDANACLPGDSPINSDVISEKDGSSSSDKKFTTGNGCVSEGSEEEPECVATKSVLRKISKESPNNRANSIPEDVVLSPLTEDLKKARKVSGVLQSSRLFIPHWANHLMSLTNAIPSKRDYLRYANGIVAAFPELKGGTNNSGIVKTQLSIYIRNKRIRDKKRYCDKRVQVDDDDSDSDFEAGESPKRPKVSLVSKVKESSQDAQESITELGKYKSDSKHVRRLLKDTVTVRHDWIRNKGGSIKEVVEKYSQLGIASLVIYDFTLVTEVQEADLLERATSFLASLAKASSLHDAADSARDKVSCLLWMFKEVTPKKFLSSCKPLISLRKVMDSAEDLEAQSTDAPRAVLYTTPTGSLDCSYIVADSLTLDVPVPTVEKTLVCLLASYYVWNVAYPPAYSNALHFIDKHILNTAIPSSALTLSKFIRAYFTS